MSLVGGGSGLPEGDARVGGAKPSDRRTERQKAARLAAELAALIAMTGARLAKRFRELKGRPPRTRNKAYLRKRVAWLIQARAEGGLSERALVRIEELGSMDLPRWRRSTARQDGASFPPATAGRPVSDPRLPAVSTVLARIHAGAEHRVTVLADGFEYNGQRYRSLSKIARVVTGTPWNGYLFFFGRARGMKSRAAAGGR